MALKIPCCLAAFNSRHPTEGIISKGNTGQGGNHTNKTHCLSQVPAHHAIAHDIPHLGGFQVAAHHLSAGLAQYSSSK